MLPLHQQKVNPFLSPYFSSFSSLSPFLRVYVRQGNTNSQLISPQPIAFTWLRGHSLQSCRCHQNEKCSRDREKDKKDKNDDFKRIQLFLTGLTFERRRRRREKKEEQEDAWDAFNTLFLLSSLASSLYHFALFIHSSSRSVSFGSTPLEVSSRQRMNFGSKKPLHPLPPYARCFLSLFFATPFDQSITQTCFILHQMNHVHRCSTFAVMCDATMSGEHFTLSTAGKTRTGDTWRGEGEKKRTCRPEGDTQLHVWGTWCSLLTLTDH